MPHIATYLFFSYDTPEKNRRIINRNNQTNHTNKIRLIGMLSTKQDPTQSNSSIIYLTYYWFRRLKKIRL